ncbi:SsgA family sporulation/cell division regulator [Streptomyces sp. NPDC002537]
MIQDVGCEMPIDLILDEYTFPVRAVFKYSSSCPYEVQVTFMLGGQEVASWRFARSLLVQGIARFSGAGNVHVWPDSENGESVVYLGLHGTLVGVLFRVRMSDLIIWNSRTQSLVPLGAEHLYVDVDAGLAELFSE